PGMEYTIPPSQDKSNPLEIEDIDTFMSIIKNNDQRTPIYKAIYTSFTGISPLISREICHRSSVDEKIILSNLNDETLNTIYVNFSDIIKQIKINNFTPYMYYDDINNKYID